MKDVPIIPLYISGNYELEPSTVDLTLTGDDASLAKIDAAKLFITIDASADAEQGTHSRKLTASDFTVNLPAGVSFDEEKFPEVLLKVWKDDNVETPESDEDNSVDP